MHAYPICYVVVEDLPTRRTLETLVKAMGIAVRCHDTIEELEAEYAPRHPGCVLIDVGGARPARLELAERLLDRRFAPPVIVVTGRGDVPTAVRALKAGAHDFLELPLGDGALLASIEQALLKDRSLRAEALKRAEIEARLERLSPREAQVFSLVTAGRANKLIALELSLSQKTVEVHRAHVMEKMRAETFADLVKMALLVGATGPPQTIA